MKTIKNNIALLLLIINIITTGYSQEKINVLYLGNSYTSFNNLPSIVEELCIGTDKTIESRSITPGGCTLFQHLANKNTISVIKEGIWDFVVLQEQSQLPTIDYYRHNSFTPSYKALYDTIMLYNSNAKVVGYMTWGRRYGGQQCENYGDGLYCSPEFIDFDHMQDSLCSAYCEAAYLTDSYVAPVGMAWKNILNNHNIVLHISDDSHPSYEGSYLSACVLYSVFWNESPIGCYHSSQIGDRDAATLQKTAHDTFFDNLEQWNYEYDYLESSLYDNITIHHNSHNNDIIIRNINRCSINIRIYDIKGNVVYESENNDEKINIKVNKGIYIVSITDENNNMITTEKIIKL